MATTNAHTKYIGKDNEALLEAQLDEIILERLIDEQEKPTDTNDNPLPEPRYNNPA